MVINTAPWLEKVAFKQTSWNQAACSHLKTAGRSSTQWLLIITTLILLSGCQTKPAPKTDPAVLMLKSVASDVRRITRRVNEIQQASAPQYKPAKVSDPRLKKRLAVLDYVGSAPKILDRIARHIGYELYVNGKTTNTLNGLTNGKALTNLDVVLRVEDQQIINIIRDIGAQLGRQAIVSVSEIDQRIVLEVR